MRLSRQLIALLLALVILLFAGTFGISLHNARDYLGKQLASHAQDAATSLGLSLTSHLAQGDMAVVQSMADAMFDRGDYLQVRVEGLDGEPWVDRRISVGAPDVPAWFVANVELTTPLGVADVMQGWRQAGRVLVRSHPGHAYEQLWDTVRESLVWHLAAAGFAVLVGLAVLRLVLRPLKRVTWQAESICNREFPIVEQRPSTLEFRQVVEAMNRMSAKVQQMLSDSERRADRLREQAYRDPVTGLANRRQFMDVLQHAVAHPEGLAGGLLLLELREFKAYNQQHGYPAGDQLLAACGELLRARLTRGFQVNLAHLSGATFAVLVEHVDADRFSALAEALAAGLAELANRVATESRDIGHVGAVYFQGQSVTDLLADADAALRQAQKQRPNASVVRQTTTGRPPVRGASAWRTELARAIAEDRFELVRQPVFDLQRQVLHQEVFLRLPDPQDRARKLAAGHFLPQAEALGLMTEIDRWVLQRVLGRVRAGSAPVAVNLAAATFEDAACLDWLDQELDRLRLPAGQVLLEVSEYGAGAHVAALSTWIERLAPRGVHFCLDHFGRGFSSFEYLRTLKAHSLKIDGSLVRDLDLHSDNQFYIQALCDIAHGLDMQVIAESVEKEWVWQILPGLGVDGGQGYWLGEPN